MAGENNWSIPTDGLSYLRQQQKEQDWQARRPSVRKASDIMGPALGPAAIQIIDLNSDTAAFNGMYLVPPGALNSPDRSKWWAGTTVADGETGGRQSLRTFLPEDAPHAEAHRGFRISADGAVRQFSNWDTGVEPDPTVYRVGQPGAPAFENGWANWSVANRFYPVQFYEQNGRIYLEGMADKSATPYNSAIFTVPAWARPEFEFIAAGVAERQTTNGPSTGTSHTHTYDGTGVRVNVQATTGAVSVTGHTGWVNFGSISWRKRPA